MLLATLPDPMVDVLVLISLALKIIENTFPK